jgi:hypothetical protein
MDLTSQVSLQHRPGPSEQTLEAAANDRRIADLSELTTVLGPVQNSL